ncbi:hypothetical protein BJY00DRAFT_311399 [Aspergillus carlsbadensis]|nr:hypothetical protein BJY00DRAFT_311399 [Aspergillus carlsbadensis]
MKGFSGGGASVPIPIPLAERQRRRAAIKWIIDASDKRRDTKFAQRVANELVSVAEGRSGVWDRRDLVYKYYLNSNKEVQEMRPVQFTPVNHGL